MRPWLFAAALSGALAVLLGAFAAHGLKGRLDAHALELFDTGARYQLIHAVAAAVAALAARGPATRAAKASATAFLVGGGLFAGSLYALALTGIGVLGAVTPFGGLGLVAGWLLLARAAVRLPEA